MTQHHDDNLKQEILGLETRYWDAIKARDAETMMELSDDTCILAGPQGVAPVAKQSFPKMVETSTYELRDYRFDDVTLERLSDDVAVVAYKVHEDLVVDGSPVSLDAAESSTWVRKNGHWVCAVHTESILGDAYGRDRGPRVDAPN